MSINVKDDALDTLRQRQNALFVAFIKELKVEKTGEDAGVPHLHYVLMFRYN